MTNLTFIVNVPLGDGSMHYRRRKEDENNVLMARKGDWFIASYQRENYVSLIHVGDFQGLRE